MRVQDEVATLVPPLAPVKQTVSQYDFYSLPSLSPRHRLFCQSLIRVAPTTRSHIPRLHRSSSLPLSAPPPVLPIISSRRPTTTTRSHAALHSSHLVFPPPLRAAACLIKHLFSSSSPPPHNLNATTPSIAIGLSESRARETLNFAQHIVKTVPHILASVMIPLACRCGQEVSATGIPRLLPSAAR